ncbi:MAG: flagellar motor stator protein MotA [Alphaproteobacteria bacterium]|nr:MAG: flagellar motor stator protein MotA [Alphaproteobacteria bacterium]TAF16097.1 MAG: flagellar motor stator protein MotA [Alphaproteobacteria bacterium]TAF75895.1 MAG: flagellar motor stator protein MotA [Alphaproteobacteria bacterium]
MKFLIGFATVIGCVLGGYVMHNGNLAVLWQPTEVIIIVGAAVGAFIIANPSALLKVILKSLKKLLKGMPYRQKEYLELLVMQYTVFKTMRTKGMLEIEQHIEHPHNSALFNSAPKFAKNHHAVDFFADYLRMMTMGVENHYELDDLMDKEINAHREEAKHITHALTSMADGMPALGIVAAVLGVIITMGSITEPPEVLGKLIGAALVGTFLGVLISYGIIAPIANYVGSVLESEVRYMECIKAGLVAYAKGVAPAVAVEYARTNIDVLYKPKFADVESACQSI